jgi:heme A synthase
MTDPVRLLAKASLVLVVILVTLSSYLRLDHSGIGCEPWPTCYGNIGIAGETPGVADTYERLLDEASQPLSWATPAHRLVASVLGILIVVMSMFAILAKRQRLISLGLLALTVFLAWLGIYSEGLHSPAVVMGNLGGGFAMLGLLGWMVVQEPQDQTNSKVLRRWVALAIVTLCLQIFLGGLTSANFAASACQTLPDWRRDSNRIRPVTNSRDRCDRDGTWRRGTRRHSQTAPADGYIDSGSCYGCGDACVEGRSGSQDLFLCRHGAGHPGIRAWCSRDHERIADRRSSCPQLARGVATSGIAETVCGNEYEVATSCRV